MTKIAYNACFGSFSLSREAVLLGRKISGDPKWAACVLKGEYYDDGSSPASSDDGHLRYGHARSDPVLIQVIEELGKRANGMCAALRIAELPSGTNYRIDEYDGKESVMTAPDYEWMTAP